MREQAIANSQGDRRLRRRAGSIGLLAAAGLLAFYVVVVLAGSKSLEHLQSLIAEDGWFVAAITTGFGIQIGLFAYLRGAVKAARGRMSAAVAATGTGGSTMAMVACCAHHLADIAPLAGMTAATLFLSEYKQPLMIVGLGATGIGIAWMWRQIRRHNHHLATVALAPDVGPMCH